MLMYKRDMADRNHWRTYTADSYRLLTDDWLVGSECAYRQPIERLYGKINIMRVTLSGRSQVWH